MFVRSIYEDQNYNAAEDLATEDINTKQIHLNKQFDIF